MADRSISIPGGDARGSSWSRVRRRARTMTIIGVAGVLATPALIAYADDISNSLDASIDATAEIMPLNVGGADGTTTLYVVPLGGDGKPGCNLTGSTTLGVNVSSSDTGVATVTPAALTFGACGDIKTLTVTPVAQGTATISVAQTSNTTDGTFNLAPATFTVNVAPPANTAPVMSIDGVTAAAAYEKGSVPLATCQVTDAEDGNQSFTATLSAIIGPHAGDGIGSQTASCTYTDSGGLTATASVTYNIVDTTPPLIDVPDDFEVEANSPAGAVVTYAATASDAVDPNPNLDCSPDSGSELNLGAHTVNCAASDFAGNTSTASFTVTVEDKTAPTVNVPANETLEATGPGGASFSFTATASDLVDGTVPVTCTPPSGSTFPLGTTTVTCSATDAAGNTGSSTFTVTVIDTTPPELTGHADLIEEATSAAGVTVTYTEPTASDLVDGTVPVTCTPPSGSTFPLGTTTVTCSATDAAGNTGSSTFTVKVQDTTAPDIAPHADVLADATSASGATVTYTNPTASDLVDGSVPVTCSPASGSTFPLGTTTVTCSATDAAGNTASTTFKVSVQLRLSGFYQPVDMGLNVVNTVKSGSTVPLKFEVFAGTTELTNTSVVKTFTYALTSCENFVGGTEDAIETVTSGNTVLRYDSAAGQFIQNWQTPKNSAGKCYRVTMTTQDGSSIVANFKLK